METKPAVYSLSIGRMLALLVHYFAGYLYVYRIVATKITLAVEPGATILLPWVQLLIYVFTAGVAILLAWPVLRDSWMKFRRNTGANLKMSAYLIVVILAVNMLLSLLIGLLTQTGNSVNQEEIRNASTVLPLMTILSTCVFAPIIEETVFRAGAFSCLRSRIGFWAAASSAVSCLGPSISWIHFLQEIWWMSAICLYMPESEWFWPTDMKKALPVWYPVWYMQEIISYPCFLCFYKNN